MLVLERALERREAYVDAVDLFKVGQLLRLLAPLAQPLVCVVVVARILDLLLDEIVQIALVHAEQAVRLVRGHDLLDLGEELGGLLVHHEQRLRVALGHVAEDLEHLVLAQLASAGGRGDAGLLDRIVKVAEPFEAGRDRDELLDLAEEVSAQLLERGAQLQLARLEAELAPDVRQLLVQGLEAELVLMLKRLEELHVPVLAPPLHARVVGLQRVDRLAERLDPLLPLGLLAQQRDAHELRHLLAHGRVHLAQLAVLLREALGGRVQVLDVALELRRVGPRDHLAARAVRRLGGRVGRELLELKRMVEQQGLLRAHDLLLVVL